MSNFMKVRPVRAGLFHADGRTDGKTDLPKLTVDCRNFVNVSNTHTHTLTSQLTDFRDGILKSAKECVPINNATSS